MSIFSSQVLQATRDSYVEEDEEKGITFVNKAAAECSQEHLTTHDSPDFDSVRSFDPQPQRARARGDKIMLIRWDAAAARSVI